MSEDSNDHQLGDAPIEQQYRAQMEGIAEVLDDVFNPGLKHPDKKVGFVLLTFEYGSHEGRCNFLSNGADRNDIVKLFREMIARFQGQPDSLLPGGVSGKEAYDAYEWLRQLVKNEPDNRMAEVTLLCWHKAAGGEIESLENPEEDLRAESDGSERRVD